MIEQAIPKGISSLKHTPTEYRRSVARVTMILLCFTLLMGCRKVSPTAAATLTPDTAGQQAAGPGEGKSGRSAILQLPFDNVAQLVFRNIGKAYQMALVSNNKPPKDATELDAGPKGLKTFRDMQDHVIEVVYGVNPSKLDNPADYMIAWEKEPTNDGYRMVMMADFTTVKYISTAEFEKTKRAK